MSEPVQVLWKYEAGDRVSAVAITSDGRFVMVGSNDKNVYCFRQSGDMLWLRNVDSEPFRLALAEKSQHILAGCSSGRAYQWDFEGNLIRVYETDGNIWGVGITADSKLVALGTLNNSLYLFDERGTLLWERKVGGGIRRLSIAADGYIALGSDDNSIYLFDRTGKECWHYTTHNAVWAGVQMSTTQYIVAGSNDHFLYLLDKSGQLRWQNDTGGKLNIATLTPDGKFIAAAGEADAVFMFNNRGELLWSYKTGGDVYGLDISADGRFLVAGSDDSHIYLLDEKGSCIWKQKMRREVFSVAITPNGRWFVAGSKDHFIYAFESLVAPDDFSVPRLARNALLHIRSAYTSNQHLGLAYWFDEFDRSLLQREFANCLVFLKEIREEGYQLDEKEQVFVDSREGALLLCQGISYHQQGEYEKALHYYEASCRIHHRLNDADGEGQANLALDELNRRQIGRGNKLLEHLAGWPKVLGDSSTLLAQRLERLQCKDQIKVILAAKECGLPHPLLTGLSSNDTAVQAAAATSLAWLKPGPDYSTLVNTMLISPNWLVRWQATFILLNRADEKSGEFAQYQGIVHSAIAQKLENGESDQTVRRNIAMLLCKIGNSKDTTLLVMLLADPDPDVRFAVVKALDAIGDHRALLALQHVKDGEDFLGNRIGEHAREAMQNIRQNHPSSEVQQLVLCREIETQEQPVQTKNLFLAHDPLIYCVVTISRPNHGTQVTCSVRERERIVLQQEQILEEKSLVELIEPSVENRLGRIPQTLRGLLLELIDEDDEEFLELVTGEDEDNIEQELADVTFALAPSEGKWSPGSYSVEIALDDELQWQQSFKVIGQIVIKQAVTCLAFNSASEPIDKTTTFFTNGSQIHCSVALEESPAGVEIRCQVYRTEPVPEVSLDKRIRSSIKRLFLESSDVSSFIAESVVKTITEGQQRVAFSWESATWQPGQYGIKITMTTGAEARCNFQVVPETTLPFTDRKGGQRWLDEGNSHYRTNHFGKALVAYERAIRIDPRFAPAYTGKGDTLYRLNRYEESLLAYEQAIRIDPRFAPAYTGKGDALYRLNRYEEALAACEQAIRFDPNLILAYYNKGKILRDMKRNFVASQALEQTISVFESAIQLNPNSAIAYNSKGNALYYLNRYEEALAAYEQAIDLDPNFAYAYKGRGDQLYNLNRYEEALAAYEQSIRLDPYSDTVQTAKSKVLTSLGRLTEAQQAIERAQALENREE